MIFSRSPMTAAIAAALISATSYQAQAGVVCTTHWDVSLNVTSTHASIGTMQVSLGYANATGEFSGTGGSVGCNSPLASATPPPTLFGANDNEMQRMVTTAITSLDGFPAPTTFASCAFLGEIQPDPSDFVVTVVDATDTSANAISPTVTASVSCSLCGNGVLDGNEICDPGIAGEECCNPISCTEVPLNSEGCLEARDTRLQIKNLPDDAKDLLKWSWKIGAGFEQFVLGDPAVDSTYTLCLYDFITATTPSLVGSLRIDPNANWVSNDPKGYQYKDTLGSEDGVQKVKLSAAALLGRTSVQIQAKGDNLPTLSPMSAEQYFHLTPRLIVQLRNTEGTCWTSSFDAEGASKNDGVQFKARSSQ